MHARADRVWFELTDHALLLEQERVLRERPARGSGVYSLCFTKHAQRVELLMVEGAVWHETFIRVGMSKVILVLE